MGAGSVLSVTEEEWMERPCPGTNWRHTPSEKSGFSLLKPGSGARSLVTQRLGLCHFSPAVEHRGLGRGVGVCWGKPAHTKPGPGLPWKGVMAHKAAGIPPLQHVNCTSFTWDSGIMDAF